ncbi:MAG: hypothetical protein M3Y05_07995 [Gemmatimonadota bacterium]|nr:hypothetical protein [Gemmatimonadota bacterium]
MCDWDDDASRGYLNANAVSWRRRLARLFLGIAAFVQLLLILSLPNDAHRSADRRSLVVLTAMLAATLGSVIAIKRYVRQVRWVISGVGALALLIVASDPQWLRLSNAVRGIHEPVGVVWSVLIDGVMIDSMLAGAVLAWMLPTDEGSKANSAALGG